MVASTASAAEPPSRSTFSPASRAAFMAARMPFSFSGVMFSFRMVPAPPWMTMA